MIAAEGPGWKTARLESIEYSKIIVSKVEFRLAVPQETASSVFSADGD